MKPHKNNPDRSGLGLFTAIGILLLFAFAVPSQAEAIIIQSDNTWKVSLRQSTDWVDCPGTIGNPGPVWTEIGFDDSQWINSTSPWDQSFISGCTPSHNYVQMWMGSPTAAPLEVFFRKSFVLNGLPATAVIEIYVDDNFQFYVNGTFVNRKKSYPDLFDIAPYLQVGDNVIAIRAWDGDPATAACKVEPHICMSIAIVPMELREMPWIYSGSIYDKNPPQKDTFFIEMQNCTGLSDAITNLDTKTVQVDVGPFSMLVPGDEWDLFPGYYRYHKTEETAGDTLFNHLLFYEDEAIRLYGSNVVLDGIANPITVRVDIDGWSCESTDTWRELPYGGGVKYAYPLP